MEKYVFVSYSTKDIDIRNLILDKIKKEGINYWVAPDMITPGSNYAKDIPEAIKNASAFVILLSENSQESMWVEKEIDCAVNNRKRIIPVNISGVTPSEMFKFYLNNVQMIQLHKNALKGLEELKKSLLECIGEGDKIQVLTRKSSAIDGKSPIESFITLNADPGYIRRNKQGKKSLVSESDYFDRVYKYLDKFGPAPIEKIHEETGVPKESIKMFLRDQRLEIPEGFPPLLICEKCGKKIRTGYLCDSCQKGANKSDKK